MTCKILHDEDGLPAFLCRHCHPKLNAPTPPSQAADAEPVMPDTSPWADRFRKRKIRQLKNEERRLSDMIDQIGQRDPIAKARAYAAIKVVEDKIAALAAKQQED